MKLRAFFIGLAALAALLFIPLPWMHGTSLVSATPVFGLAGSGTAISGAPVPPGLYDGTNVQYHKSTSAANVSAATNPGAALFEKGSRWTVVSAPATGSQAVATNAAIASTRHVADCVTYSAAAGTAPSLTIVDVELLDGAATVKWATVAIFTASAIQFSQQTICGLNIPGSVNTAMNLEYSAGVTNVTEIVSLSGYDVQ